VFLHPLAAAQLHEGEGRALPLSGEPFSLFFHLISMQINHVERGQAERGVNVVGFPEMRSTERAVCELCGDVITTTNGGRHTGLIFLPFERLLEMHMQQRHPNVCVLPISAEHRKAA
jgi:hypothetical protein